MIWAKFWRRSKHNSHDGGEVKPDILKKKKDIKRKDRAQHLRSVRQSERFLAIVFFPPKDNYFGLILSNVVMADLMFVPFRRQWARSSVLLCSRESSSAGFGNFRVHKCFIWTQEEVLSPSFLKHISPVQLCWLFIELELILRQLMDKWVWNFSIANLVVTFRTMWIVWMFLVLPAECLGSRKLIVRLDIQLVQVQHIILR